MKWRLVYKKAVIPPPPQKNIYFYLIYVFLELWGPWITSDIKDGAFFFPLHLKKDPQQLQLISRMLQHCFAISSRNVLLTTKRHPTFQRHNTLNYHYPITHHSNKMLLKGPVCIMNTLTRYICIAYTVYVSKDLLKAKTFWYFSHLYILPTKGLLV